jgi:hypothetical protein
MSTQPSTLHPWVPVEPDIPAALARFADPIHALAEAEIPAFVLRGVLAPAQCQGLIQRFVERKLMRDPADPNASQTDARTRTDIGSSLNNLGNNKEYFLAHAQETHALFGTLFDGFDNPVDAIYRSLAALAPGKRVMVAQEPDGRRYGPAIVRCHFGGHAYPPHIDHVVLREKRFNYAVSRFKHQFAGVLCLQNDAPGENSTQAILHNCLWTPKVQTYLENWMFPEYAAKHHIESHRVTLQQGDLYFFNTQLIHEVPSLSGPEPRIVLATFIGYSPDDPDIYVWA